MPLTTPLVKIELTDFDNCNILYFKDTTGLYNAINNILGYGLPGGMAVNDITSGRILLTFNSLGTTADFNFTVASGTITVASLVFAGGASINILSLLDSTSFPFDATNSFNIYKAYGATLPLLTEDQVISAAYTITGTSGATPFSYTASQTIVVDCQINDCIKSKYCTAGINTDKYNTAKLAEAYLKIANYNAQDGAVSSAIANLNRANEICSCNCTC